MWQYFSYNTSGVNSSWHLVSTLIVIFFKTITSSAAQILLSILIKVKAKSNVYRTNDAENNISGRIIYIGTSLDVPSLI